MRQNINPYWIIGVIILIILVWFLAMRYEASGYYAQPSPTISPADNDSNLN
jgi:hypothetical protein